MHRIRCFAFCFRSILWFGSNVRRSMEGEKAKRLISSLLVLAVLSSPLIAVTVKAAYNNESGVAKDAWPEYYFAPNGTEVEEAIQASGLADFVFLWGPSPSQSPPFFPGTENSVWIYTAYDGVVYQIPKRGLFHFNRVDPGWRELVGVNYLDAIKAILEEVIGVTVQYGPQGFPRTKDYRLDRVFLDVDEAGNVAVVPKIG